MTAARDAGATARTPARTAEPAAERTGPPRRAVVTGANAGLGFFTSAGLAARGFEVVLTGRSPERLAAAVRAIRHRHPDARLGTLVMDQSSLDSVRAGAATLAEAPPAVLVLNAGIVHTPRRRQTAADGHELVLATNVLGHQALVARLLPAIEASAEPSPRIVSLGSLSTAFGSLDFADLERDRGYTAWSAYARSKVAGETFGFELDRRLRAAGSRIASVVAHPGYSISGRTPGVPGVNAPSRLDRFVDALQCWAQGKDAGAEVLLHAATAPGVRPGDYWGPRLRTRGAPVRQHPTARVRDPELGARLWRALAELTGERIPL